MLCASCQTDNQEGAKFCHECAAPLAARCVKCGAANNPRAKFCNECAAALADSSSPTPGPGLTARPAAAASDAVEGERKLLTSLFADIKGSMDLLEGLDPEDAGAIIDPALKIMIDAVHLYDGYVVHTAGDAIFALFGAPLAHQDHPQRALFAALRMQQDLKQYSQRLGAEKGRNLQVRVGVNTGEAVVRSIKTSQAHTEYTPIGHSTGLASRLQTLAQPGAVLVSGPVERLCDGYFEFRALGEAKLKGVSEAVSIYEVTGLGPLRTRFQRSEGRGLSKFVGRERESAALGRAFELAASGSGQIVAVMADPGVGKSRLFHEFKTAVAQRCKILEGYSISHGKAATFLPVIEMLKNYFAIAAEDDTDVRRAKVVGQLEALDPALKAEAGFLLPLLGVTESTAAPDQMDPQTRRQLTLEALSRVIVRESRNQPLVVIFEDLHWIDSATQGLLDLLIDAIAGERVILLVNYRPEYRHEWSNRSYYSLLSLDPLSARSADELLSSLLGDAREMAPLKRLLIAKAEGNPFFIEEIVHELLDGGVLSRNGHLALNRPIGQIVIPTTVQGVLAARIDRLARADKELLQTLAVLGRKFPRSLVDKAIGKADEGLEAGLARLQAGEFIYERPALSDPEYTFKHALTQEVAYNSLLIQRRKTLHERAAQALLALHVQRPEDCYGEVARHYRLSDNAESAIEFSCRAGGAAYGRFAYDETADEFRVALELREKHNGTLEQRATILHPLCMVVGSFGDKAEGIEYGEEAVKIYEELGQLEKAAGIRAYLGLMASSGVITDLRRTREHLRKAEAVLGKGPETAELVTLYWGIAHVAVEMTQVAEGLAASRRALEIAERINDDGLWVRASGEQIWLLFSSGQIAAALAFADRAYEKASRLNGPGADGVLHYRAQIRSYLQDNLDAAYQLVGELDKPWLHSSLRHMLIESASRYLFNAGQRERSMSLLADTGTSETFRPLVEVWSGDWDRYCRSLEKLAADRDPHGSRMERWWFLTKLATRRRLMGQHDAAQTALLSCFDFVDPADLVCQMMVRSGLAILYAGEMGRTAEAKVHLARCREIMAGGEDWRGLAGDVTRAEAALAATENRFNDADTRFGEAVEIFRRYTSPWEEADTFYYWGRALLAAGDCDRAAEKFDAALAIYHRIGAGSQWLERIDAAR